MESLEAAFKDWTVKNHAFENILLREDNKRIKALSDGAKHNFSHDTEKGEYTIPSLKYFAKPKEKRFNGKARPLTNDQKVMNMLFFDLCRQTWAQKQEELLAKVAKFVQEKMAAWQGEGSDLPKNRFFLSY
jgi:hypothetical protein